MREDSVRRPEYAKSEYYEDLLRALNRDLEQLPDDKRSTVPRLPVIFVVGPPRSGTSLCYQILASSGAFGYPSNLVARFPTRPAFGWQLQQLLQPLLPPIEWSFRSRGGRTDGWWEPHEFGYFWERHLPLGDHHQPTDEDLSKVEWAGFVRHLAELESVAGKPLLFKNLILDFVLDQLAERVPTAHFVEVRRSDEAVAASIERMRIAYYGDPSTWFSVRPADWRDVEDTTPADQIRHQISRIRAALAASRSHLGSERWTEIAYHDLCKDPRGVARAIGRRVGVEQMATEPIPERFEARSG